MIVQSEALFQWLVTSIGAVISFLVGIAIYNNRLRYRELAVRLEKVEDRLNTAIPNAITDILTQMTKIEGSLQEMNTKLTLVTESVTKRVDGLEQNIPSLMESALYRAITNGQLTTPHRDNFPN